VAGHELARPGDTVEHHEGHGPGGHHEGEHHEPVLAPDQLKPTPFRRLIIVSGLLTVVCLPVMAFVGNHEGNVEKVFLVGIAGVITLAGFVGFFLKKAGLRN
jgi:hypothetical protein